LFTTYIEKDIVSLYGRQYRESTVKLLKTIAKSSGDVANYETLAMTSGLNYNETRKILPILEDSFVVFITKPFHRNLITEIRKNPKIYFVDYGIMNYLNGSFENIGFDRLYEAFINNEMKRKFNIRYWRTTSKTEVDFVIEAGKELIPIEVKTVPKVTRSFRSFISQYKPKKAFIANLETLDNKRIDGCNTHMLPFVYF
jgi:hypothetical protein